MKRFTLILCVLLASCGGDIAYACSNKGQSCKVDADCCAGLVCNNGCRAGTTVPTTSTSVTTTTRPASSTTTLPATGYVADVWRPEYPDISLGSTDKEIHPVTGDWCDQRCLFLRIEKRAFDAWPLVIRYLRDIGLLVDAAKQVNTTQGLPMVFGEVGIENSGRELNMGGSWNFGPDYDWKGNVEGNLRRAREAIVNLSRRRPITIPWDVKVILDLEQAGQGAATIGNRYVASRRPVRNTGDPKAKLRGLVSARVKCLPFSTALDVCFGEAEGIHHANGEYWKLHHAPKPGGGAQLMAKHAECERLSRNPDDLTMNTIQAFPQVCDGCADGSRDAVIDLEHVTYQRWLDRRRACDIAGTWSANNEHTRAHLLAALNVAMALRVSTQAPREALGMHPACTDKTLDRCPNLPFPPS